MTDLETPPIETKRPQPAPRSRRFGWIVVVALATGLTAGAAVTTAFSRPGGFGPMGWHGHGGFMGRPFDPAQAEARADRMVRHLAVELDATNEQQDKLRSVVKGAVKDVVPMREKVQTAREQARKLLTDPTINRTEIEKLRSEQVALADAFSKRVAQALTDAAEVLTPEQRRKLNERFPGAGAMSGAMHPMDGPMGGPMGGHGRGWNR